MTPEHVQIGAIDRPLPSAVLQAKSHINDRAQAAHADPRVLVWIRKGLPRMAPTTAGKG